MSAMPSVQQIDPNETAVLTQVHQLWNSGNQAQALELLEALAKADRPWAVALMAWLTMQQGPAGLEQSVTWALRASSLGIPWQASHTFNNLIGHVATAPALAERISELVLHGSPWVSGIDTIGQGWNLLSQGNPELALRVMSVTAPAPVTSAGWETLIKSARGRLVELENLTAGAVEERAQLSNHASEAKAAIAKASDDLQTSAKQAGLLVTATTSEATNALFKADAKRNTEEARGAWVGGLIVLGAATLVALLPLLLHYLDQGPNYSATALIGAHAASTLALATFSGVLLTRGRSRDQAAQRANDLSTAMGTMIAYSNQIKDPTEKERFMMTMGQLVLQAHLTAGTGHHAKDESLSGMLALANLMRSPTGSAPTPAP